MASGTPNTLYTHAQRRLRLIVPNIERERSRAATTSSRSDRMSTISAASTATDVPEESAMPTVAAASAGESLIPSPTWRMLHKAKMSAPKKRQTYHSHAASLFFYQLCNNRRFAFRAHSRPHIFRFDPHLLRDYDRRLARIARQQIHLNSHVLQCANCTCR